MDDAIVSRGNTQAAVDAFLQRVISHVEVGKAILSGLIKSPVVQPPPSHEAWGDFLLVGDMLTTLYQGIAVLEVRLEIHAPEGIFPSELHSNVRRWYEKENEHLL